MFECETAVDAAAGAAAAVADDDDGEWWWWSYWYEIGLDWDSDVFDDDDEDDDDDEYKLFVFGCVPFTEKPFKS